MARRLLWPDSFWARVDMTGGPDACWPWTGGEHKTGRGYGKVHVPGQGPELTHVVAYELTFGPVDRTVPNHAVLHIKCDNPPCCNPLHLLSGRQCDNITDMISKGRMRGGNGERHNKTRFTELQIREMRRRYSEGEHVPHLALEYEIAISGMYKIVRHLSWKHVA